MTHIFISYSKLNIDFARHLRALLEAEGFAVWMDETQLVPSEEWFPAIERNIVSCAAFLVIMSPESQSSRWVEREILIAEEERKPIFPILYSGRGWRRLGEIQHENMRAGLQAALSPRLVQTLAKTVPPSAIHAVPPQLPGPLLPEEPPLTDEPVGTPFLASAVPPPHPALVSPRPEGEGQGVRVSRRLLLPALGLIVLIAAALLVALPALNPPQPTPTVPAAVVSTNTNTPPAIVADSPTLDPANFAQATFDAVRTATATLWTPTPSPTLTPTDTPIPTTDVQGTINAQVTALFATDQAAIASVSITRNADWTPHYQSFDSVEMALVPIGCFMMGSDTGADDEKPVHQQCFDQPFWIDRTEVTNAQYGSSGTFSGDNRPRESVTWFQARDFCAQRGARLPSEREWEYAARGPDNLIYPWGNDFVADNAVNSGNSGNQTADVGSRPVGDSWVGASDLSGNVLEWVSTIYQPYPYRVDDGRESNGDSNSWRVLRGGSWGESGIFLRAPDRSWDLPALEYDAFGFRCARS